MFLVFSVWAKITKSMLRDARQMMSQSQETQPNFLFFFPDDFGYNDVNYTSGLGPLDTNNIDMLAMDGVRLTNYYTGPVCTPARCALMTGRHIMRTGCHNDAGEDNTWSLNLNEILIPEILMSGGYHSVLYGKWHLGFHSWEHMPTMRGFDEFRGFLGGAVGQANHTDEGLYDWWNGTSIDISANGEYVAYLVEEYMYDLIDRYVSGSLGKPFFAYLPMSLPHGPLGAPAEYTELFEDERGEDSDMTLWLSELKMLDDLVGNLWEYLYNTGLLWNTYIIFAGDHGSPQYDPSGLEVSRNYPFSGGKGTLWEGGVRCPAWIYNPGIPSVKIDTLTSVTDWLPTLAELAGVTECDVPGNVDGMSLVNLWTDGEEDNYWRMLLVEVNPDCRARRRKDEGEEEGEANPSAAIRYGPYKLTSTCVDYNGSYSDLYFYNLENDIEETTNLVYTDLSDDEQFIIYLMSTELRKLAQEAYPTEPNWNQGVYCPNLQQNCSCGYVDQMETLVPWSTCSRYYIGNAYENYTWGCEPYCTDAVGGVMPSAGVISNRAEGTNTCPTQSPTVAPSVHPTGAPSVMPSAPPTPQPSSDPTQPRPAPSQSPSLEPAESASSNPTHSPSVKTTHAPSTAPTTQMPSLFNGRNQTQAPSTNPATQTPSRPKEIDTTWEPSPVPVTKIPTWVPTRDQSNAPSSDPITQKPSYLSKAPSLSPTNNASSEEDVLRSSAHNLVPRWILLAMGIALFAMILSLWRFKGRGQLSSLKLKRYTNHYSNKHENVKLNKTVINGSQRTTSEPLEAKISSKHSIKPFTRKITNKRSASYISLIERKGTGYGSVSCLL